MITKRFRVFADPNGSGKSSLYDYLVKQKFFTERLDVNADKIAKDLKQKGFSVKGWPISCSVDEFLASACKNTRPSNDITIEYVQKKNFAECRDGEIVFTEGIDEVPECFDKYILEKTK